MDDLGQLQGATKAHGRCSDLTPLRAYVGTVERHECISLGLLYVMSHESSKVESVQFFEAEKSIALPSFEPVFSSPALPLPSNASKLLSAQAAQSSQPPSLCSGSTANTLEDEPAKLGNEEEGTHDRAIPAAKLVSHFQTSQDCRFYCTSGCRSCFTRKGDWKRHQERHYPQARWVCCGKDLSRLDKWRDHQRSIHQHDPSLKEIRTASQPLNGNFPAKCGFCGKNIAQWSGWVDHVADHFLGKVDGGPWTLSRWNKHEVLVMDKKHDANLLLSAPRLPREKMEMVAPSTRPQENPSSDSSIDDLHDQVIQSLVDGITILLCGEQPYRSRPKSDRPNSGRKRGFSAHQGAAYSSESTGRARREIHSSPRKAEEDSEGEQPDDTTFGKVNRAISRTSIEFACPYHKSDPGGSHLRKCERGSWKTISKLKYEHLQRHHEVDLSTVTDEILQSVYGKGTLTLEEKWAAIYLILCPAATDIPCPYYGIDWPPSVSTTRPTFVALTDCTRPPPSSQGMNPTEETMHSSLLQNGFLQAVMTNVRYMMEEEEKLRLERINSKIPQIVSDTYWDFLATMNRSDISSSSKSLEDTPIRRTLPAAASTIIEPSLSDPSTFEECLGLPSVAALPFGAVHTTSADASPFAERPPPPLSVDQATVRPLHFSADCTHVDANLYNHVYTSPDNVQTRSLDSEAHRPDQRKAEGESKGKSAPRDVQGCNDPMSHSAYIDLGGNYCHACGDVAFPASPDVMAVVG